MLQTDAGSLVYIQNAGIRHAPPDVTKKLLAGEPVDPSQVYFKTVPTFETSAPELQWLTRSIFVGTGERRPTEVDRFASGEWSSPEVRGPAFDAIALRRANRALNPES